MNFIDESAELEVKTRSALAELLGSIDMLKFTGRNSIKSDAIQSLANRCHLFHDLFERYAAQKRMIEKRSELEKSKYSEPATDNEAADEYDRDENGKPRFNGKRVLFVEDDHLFREALSCHLRRWGFLVVTAKSAEAALGILDTEPAFDFGIFDYSLPGMSGEELAAHCRSCSDLKDMKIISLSGICVSPQTSLFEVCLWKPVMPDVLRHQMYRLEPRFKV